MIRSAAAMAGAVLVDRVLIRKYAEQSVLLWLACGLVLLAFSWIRVWVVSLLDMGQFQTILEQFREYERFAPVSFDQLFTYTGRVGMTFDEPVVILCIVIWCVARGSDVVSGELGRGTLEMVLAQPISRSQLMLSHAVVSSIGLAGLTLLVWLGIWLGVMLTTVQETVPPPTLTIPLLGFSVPLTTGPPETVTVPMSARVDPAIFASSVWNLFTFGFFLLGLSSLMSSWDRYRWRTVGLVVGIYVLQLVMFGLSKAATQLEWMRPLTFFSCYRPQQLIAAAMAAEDGAAGAAQLQPDGPLQWIGPVAYPLILLMLGLLCYAVAIRIFARRDLPAPL